MCDHKWTNSTKLMLIGVFLLPWSCHRGISVLGDNTLLHREDDEQDVSLPTDLISIVPLQSVIGFLLCIASVVGTSGLLYISSVATVFVFNTLYLLVQMVVHKSIRSTYFLFHNPVTLKSFG